MAKKKEYVCDNCKFYIDNKCEHTSNIQIILKKRIEKKVYKSQKKQTECKFCLTKN